MSSKSGRIVDNFTSKLFLLGIIAAGLVTALALVRSPAIFRSQASNKNWERKLSSTPMADVNRDGIVDTADMEVFREIFTIVGNGGWTWGFYSVDLNHDMEITIVDGSAIGSRVGRTVTNCHWADTNGNGVVNKSDLDEFNNYYNNNAGEITHITNRYDINNDSYFNMEDVTLAEKELGKRCK